jgi:hypothetical protein
MKINRFGKAEILNPQEITFISSDRSRVVQMFGNSSYEIF